VVSDGAAKVKETMVGKDTADKVKESVTDAAAAVSSGIGKAGAAVAAAFAPADKPAEPKLAA
jgi:hypothetical protein